MLKTGADDIEAAERARAQAAEMKQYMEQITKDPQFEALKKQTESLLQEEGFVESMQKAFSDLGSMAALGGAPAADGDGEDESK